MRIFRAEVIQVSKAATLAVEDQNGVYPDSAVEYLLISPKTDTNTRFGKITNLNAPVIPWKDSIVGGYKIFVTAPVDTALSADSQFVFAGHHVTFTATVRATGGGAAPTGTITFYDGSVAIGTVAVSTSGFPGAPSQAVLTTSSLAAGSHSITAVYSGDSTHSGSTSSTLVETVQKIPMIPTFSTSTNSPTFGQAVTFTASVTPDSQGVVPTGTVSLYDNGVFLIALTLGDAAANYKATFITSGLSRGSHTITMTYAGDQNFTGGSSSVSVNVS